MCNPNALYYQQMVTSPNAYWLNFFLKRDINVLCWNYRGYGESSRDFLETVSPYKSKRDAEYVMAFLVNKLRVKGKIGVYGRSIGGLTACHLANKYSNLVKSLIVDRSFYELSSVVEGKIKGDCTSKLHDLLTWKWRTLNHTNYVVTKNCYKIIICDPLDDTIDLFSNLATGVAQQLATINYLQLPNYTQFFDTLIKVFAYEHSLYENLTEAQQESLNEDVTEAMTLAEKDHHAQLDQQDKDKCLLSQEIEEITDVEDEVRNISTSLNHTDEDHLMQGLNGDEENLAQIVKENQQRISKSKSGARKSDLVFDSFSEQDASLPAEFNINLFESVRFSDPEYA